MWKKIFKGLYSKTNMKAESQSGYSDLLLMAELKLKLRLPDHDCSIYYLFYFF